MSAPFITKRTTALDFSRAESATEVVDAFNMAVNNIEEQAKTAGLHVVWGQASVTEESPEQFSNLFESGPFLTVPMVGGV